MRSPMPPASGCATCRCRRQICARRSTSRSRPGKQRSSIPCHCEERSDEAILLGLAYLAGDCFAPLAMTAVSDVPRVVITGMAARRFTGGQTEVDVDANTVRRMIAELERRFPGLGHQIDEGMAVAIDGESFQDASQRHPNPDGEVGLTPKIGAG